MDRILEFGRRAWFLVRVISGYEEKRIRSYRLELQRRFDEAQARKADLKRLPEKAILAEVRRMVEEMQNLNRQLEDTEAAIVEYFKPIDKNAEIIMNLQLEKEEKQMKEMMKAIHDQSMLHGAARMEQSESKDLGSSQPTQSAALASSQPEQIK